MNKSVSYYIAELLFLHDCVIIPGFGGFVGNRIGAQLNEKTGVLTPPSKQILFNPNLKTNDGLLTIHIANQEGISQKSAQENVAAFKEEIANNLAKAKVLRIEKIGLFTIGKEGNITFLQDSNINYNLDSFGMKSTYKKPLIRKTKTEEQIQHTVKKIRRKSKNPKFLLRAAAVMIPLLSIGYLSISQQDNITNVYTQIATFDPFSKTKIIVNDSKNEAEELIDTNTEFKTTIIKEIATIKDQVTTEVISEKTSSIVQKLKSIYIKLITRNTVIKQDKPEVIEETINEITENTTIIEETSKNVFIPKNTYYIIGGAFSDQKNATKMLNKLTRKNYNAEIITEGSLMRVSYSSFYNREDAILSLNQIKQENPEAWLLTK